MGYDYRTAASQPGASARSARDGDERSMAWSLENYPAAGVPLERTLLGLPLYGVAWPTARRIAAPRGPAKAPSGCRAENLATLRDRKLTPTIDPMGCPSRSSVRTATGQGDLLRHAPEPDPEARPRRTAAARRGRSVGGRLRPRRARRHEPHQDVSGGCLASRSRPKRCPEPRPGADGAGNGRPLQDRAARGSAWILREIGLCRETEMRRLLMRAPDRVGDARGMRRRR